MVVRRNPLTGRPYTTEQIQEAAEAQGRMVAASQFPAGTGVEWDPQTQMPIGLPGPPPKHRAREFQYRAAEMTRQRREALWDSASQALEQGAQLLTRYRPGGASALASGIYQSQANLWADRASDLEEPDLSGSLREDALRRAQRAARRSNILGTALGIAGGALAGPLGAAIGGAAGSALGGGTDGGTGLTPAGAPAAGWQPAAARAPSSGVQSTGGAGSPGMDGPTIVGAPPGGMQPQMGAMRFGGAGFGTDGNFTQAAVAARSGMAGMDGMLDAVAIESASELMFSATPHLMRGIRARLLDAIYNA